MLAYIVTIFCSVLASSGLWALIARIADRDSAEKQLLKGLALLEICRECKHHIENGYITLDDYHDLKTYLYDPYRKLGGNGTAEKLFKQVEQLPIR